MNPLDRRLWLDLQSARYHEALELSDLDTQAAIWALAETDAELEAALHRVHTDLASEDQVRTTESVAESIRQHLPSAQIEKFQTGPITVADVAEELFRRAPKQLSAAAHQLNERLRQSAEELPGELGLSKLTVWAESKFGSAELGYWKAFREIALILKLRVAAETDYQLAARQSPKPGGSP